MAMYDGPWYECVGPTASEVREDVLKHINIIKTGNDKYENEKDKIIQDALFEIIPDTRNDFGSWRGYSTFGIKTELAQEVIKKVKIGYALFTLKRELRPYIMHYLYKPDGIRAKNLEKTTLVGKKKCNHGYWYSN